MPKVSIVIPTRNRAHLLKSALYSALSQTYEDTEIVVSDNFCTDNTKDVVASFESSRLRYVKTKEPLSMPDSWEFALSHAEGEYITYLSDDCYLFKNAIEMALSELSHYGVQLVVWNSCGYFCPDWLEAARKNVLYVPRTSSSSRILSSTAIVRDIFNLQTHGLIPKILNTLCSRSLFQSIIEIQKRAFLPPCADYSCAIALLQQVKEYIFIDSPLYIDGRSLASIGGAYRSHWGQASQEFFKEFKGQTDFTDAIDLKVPTVSVLIAQSVLNAKKFYPTIPYEINKKRLICDTVKDLVVIESNGGDVSEAWLVLEEYLSRQPEEMRKAAKKQRNQTKMKLILKGIHRKFPFWEYFDRLRSVYAFKGSQWGFSNLQECGEVAPQLIKRVAKIRGEAASPAHISASAGRI